jgi:hypothetical protein
MLNYNHFRVPYALYRFPHIQVLVDVLLHYSMRSYSHEWNRKSW